MSVLQSNRDAFLVALPMVVCLFAGFFRLDQLWCVSRKKPECGRRLTRWDENGIPMCEDPEMASLTIERKRY